MENHTEKSIWDGLDLLWEETTGDPNISVAVLDGPVDHTHPCFNGAQFTPLATGKAAQTVSSHHGTHIASIIFGQPSSAIRGIAPRCRGWSVPVYTEDQEGQLAPCSQLNLARAITQAVEQGAQIINISGGELVPSGQPEAFLAQAIRFCTERGVLIVAAAGNDSCACLHVPAAIPSVLAVGAMNAQGKPLAFSNWGNIYQTQGILAPGENIIGAVPGGGTQAYSGTSFATPIVSGIAALLVSIQRSRGDKPDPYAVRTALLKSAYPCNPQETSECQHFLVGRLNIRGAYQLIKEGGIKEIPIKTVVPQTIQTLSNQNMLDSQPQGGSALQPAAFLASGSEPLQPHLTLEETIMSEPIPVPEGQQLEELQMTSAVSPNSLETSSTELKEQWKNTLVQEASLPHTASPSVQAASLSNSGWITPSQVNPSQCNGKCNGGNKPPLVYALGAVGYDLSTEARQDALVQGGLQNPHDPIQVLAYLDKHPWDAASLIWTLNIDQTPIYAIQPAGPFAAEGYNRLREFLRDQIKVGVQRVSIPGFLVNQQQATLMSGQTVPYIVPELRGMYSWTTEALVQALVGAKPKEAKDQDEYQRKQGGIFNFLDRVYYELRNLGVSSEDRALNFAATNAFQVENIYEQAMKEAMELNSINVAKSPICRPGSDCWDVILTFFDPKKRLEQANKVYRFTVDVSDVVPVTVGAVRSWSVY